MNKGLKRSLRIIGWVLAGITLVGVLGMLVFSVIYSPAYVYRAIRYGKATVYDYKIFPARALETGATSFQFSTSQQEDRVRSQFQSIFNTADLDSFLSDQHSQAFIIIQNDKILYEHYFNGTQRESLVTSFSMAKSFTSALIGAAIQDGYIKAVDDPITDYLPEMAKRDPRFAKITIRNLLMMSSGIHYVENGFINGDDALTYLYPDLRKLALDDTRIIDAPGAYFLYDNFHPLLLGMILERATGKPVAQYLQEKIWGSIGMEYAGSWSLDAEKPGFEKMESGINARAIDFAKFGRLFLEQGNWNGTQVLPADWVNESTRRDTSINTATFYSSAPFRPIPGLGFYKYMWWGMQREDGASDFYARGNYGQFIYVSPEKNLIIVRNGEDFGIPGDAWVQAFYKFASQWQAQP
jgi:CubicO group peptidase (beta-lactamase class C family)